MSERFDILIAGGGPVGAALAIALRDSGYSISLLESQTGAASAPDARTIALSHGSRLILERLRIWKAIAAEATPIASVHIGEQRGFGRAELKAADAGVDAMGYVIAYNALQKILRDALQRQDALSIMQGCTVSGADADQQTTVHVTVDDGSVQARTIQTALLVIADGGAAEISAARVETRDYHQAALICNITSEQLHQNRAFERFTTEGPLALLPYGNGWSIVWTASPEHASELAALDDASFCQRLYAAFGGTLGMFNSPGARSVFPLSLKRAEQTTQPRTVLIGNAAQVLHPVAGQGYNLGLRDAWELARTIVAHPQRDPGDVMLLKAYLSQRSFDRTATTLFTDSLIRLFCNDNLFLNSARGLGLAALGIIPSAKKYIARRMMFGVRG